MSSNFGLFFSESMTHKATETFRKSSLEMSSSFVPSGSVSSLINSSPVIILRKRLGKFLNSKRWQNFSTFSSSTDSRQGFSGKENSMGTSRIIVASVLENSASSSPSSSNLTILSVTPAFLKAVLSFFNFL